ncbi:VanZ family protein [Streptomyces albipurpureus]|uniref:VanZ family protein n=1 Tax=Streptomyces albipurpureus TaxID=2897419 RepID=A0ABT0UUP2_9ACTN|nr:VanZ family protein [Streptomyces sp. CWNU-1]MCM2391835.1 VanZ family protein [Streptomyces sp. CWNU-1]
MTVAVAALVAFSVVLARLTLTPSTASADIAGANLQPGKSLRQYAEEYTFLAACKQVGGNLLLGAPFGVILPVLVPRRLRMLRMLLLTIGVMVFVELAQGALVEGRAFDVDDVILNTSGALIAYLLLGRRIGRHFHHLAESDQRLAAERAEKAKRAKEQESAAALDTQDARDAGDPTAAVGPRSGKPSLRKPVSRTDPRNRANALARLRVRFGDGFSSRRPRAPRRP